MVAIRVALNNIEDTGTALDRAGVHEVVPAQPAGRAGGAGMGFNGGEPLALAIGGRFCNDLRYMAGKMDIEMSRISGSAQLDMEAGPLVATRAELTVDCVIAGGGSATALIAAAGTLSTVGSSALREFPVEITERNVTT